VRGAPAYPTERQREGRGTPKSEGEVSWLFVKGNEKTGEDGPIRVEGENFVVYGFGKIEGGGPMEGERLRRWEK
jgi:hypothetical protein